MSMIIISDASCAVEQLQDVDAKSGVDYADVGHCDLEIIQIVEVDDDSEFYNDKRVIWY